MNPIIYLSDWIKAGAISLGITLTSVFQPYTDFKRPENIIQNIPLQQKADIFESNILEKHLSQDGIFLYEIPDTGVLGDMCTWNGVHVAYRAIRYGYTKDPNDLVLLKRCIKSLELMQTHPATGNTLLIRGVLRTTELPNPDQGQPRTFQNETWTWTENASGDSFGGHMFGMAMSYKYGDQEVKDYVADLSRKLYLKLKADKYHLTNSDGSKTKFHQIGPMVISSPMSVTNLLVLAKILELHYPNEVVGKEYHRLAIHCNQINVASHTFPMFLWQKKYAGLNLAKMSLYSLYELEINPKYKKKYAKGFKRGWKALKEDGDSLLTIMVFHINSKIVKQRQLDRALSVLNEFSTNHKLGVPIDLRAETSIRKVTWGELKAVEPYPVWQQPAKDYYWQRDPHGLKDWLWCTTPYNEFTGVDFLIAYYMGRLHGVIN